MDYVSQLDLPGRSPDRDDLSGTTSPRSSSCLVFMTTKTMAASLTTDLHLFLNSTSQLRQIMPKIAVFDLCPKSPSRYQAQTFWTTPTLQVTHQTHRTQIHQVFSLHRLFNAIIHSLAQIRTMINSCRDHRLCFMGTCCYETTNYDCVRSPRTEEPRPA